MEPNVKLNYSAPTPSYRYNKQQRKIANTNSSVSLLQHTSKAN